MKIVFFAAFVAVSIAAPQYGYPTPTQPPPPPAPAPPSPSYGAPSASSRVASIAIAPPVAILRDNRLHDDDGSFNVEFEAENGIVFAQSGSPAGPENSVVKTGMYSYTAPDGTFVEVKYVADENGYQPQSDLLPVAPEFPHPIPQFVLDQIAFAAAEDAAAQRAAASAPAGSYAAPSAPAPAPAPAIRNTYSAPPQPPATSYRSPQ